MIAQADDAPALTHPHQCLGRDPVVLEMNFGEFHCGKY
jgi:hypothetical protein